MNDNRKYAPADGLLGDMKVTLDVPMGTSISIFVGATLIFLAFFLCRKFLA